jgi:hypothetical protein
MREEIPSADATWTECSTAWSLEKVRSAIPEMRTAMANAIPRTNEITSLFSYACELVFLEFIVWRRGETALFAD